MGRGKRESRYNLRGDSWFAVQGEEGEQEEQHGQPQAAASREPFSPGNGRPETHGNQNQNQNQNRQKLKGGVPLRDDPEASFPLGSAPPHDASSSTTSPASSSHSHPGSSSSAAAAPYSHDEALSELIHRFGRWENGLGLYADVIESVLVQLGGDRDAAAAALLELTGGGAPGEAHGAPAAGSTSGPPGAGAKGKEASPSGLPGDHPTAEPRVVLRATGAGESSSSGGGSSSGGAVYDPGRPEGSDLWQLLPLECQERILTSVDVRCLSGLAASCRQCCAMVRGLRARVRRLSVPGGLNAARAAGLLHAHWRASELSFKPCCRTFTDFTPLFLAAASPPLPFLSSTLGEPSGSELPDNTLLSAPAPAPHSPVTGAGPGAGGPSAYQPYQRSLSSVNLSGCAHLQDADVRALLRLHPRLTHLDLSHCPLLTDNTLMALAEYPLREEEGGGEGGYAEGGGEGGYREGGGEGGALQASHSQDQYRGFPSDSLGDPGQGGRGSLLPWKRGQGLGSGGPGGSGGRGGAGAGQGPLALTRVGNGSLMLRPVPTEGDSARPSSSSSSSAHACSSSTGTNGNSARSNADADTGTGASTHPATPAGTESASASAHSALLPNSYGKGGVPRRGCLEVLSIAGCAGMTDDGLATLLGGQGVRASLRRLDISRCPHLGPWLRHFQGRASGMEALAAASLPSLASPIQLTGLPQRLHTLSLAHCAALPALTLHLRSLRSLSLDGCSSLTQASLVCPGLTALSAAHCKALSTLTTGLCPELRTLRLAHCRELPHASISALVAGAPALEEVDCSSCDGLTSLDLRGGSHAALRSLELESCRFITEVLVGSPVLEVLNVRRGKLLRRVSVGSQALRQALLSNCPLLERLDLSFTHLRLAALESKRAKELGTLRAGQHGQGLDAGNDRDLPEESKPLMEVKVDVGGSNKLPVWVYEEVRCLALICK